MIKPVNVLALPILLVCAVSGLSSCDSDSSPQLPSAVESATTIPVMPAPTVVGTGETGPTGTAELPEEEIEAPPWQGPFLGITRSSAGVYIEPVRGQKHKIAYAQEGARVPVHADPVKRDNCKPGWYRVVSGGFICGSDGTTNLEDPRIKLGPRQPDLEAILPYRYVRNAHNGTPLYRSVPSLDQIKKYEPWRFEDKVRSPDAISATKKPVEPLSEIQAKAIEEQRRRMEALRAAQRAMLGEAAAKKLEAEGADLTAPKATPAAVDGGAPKQWWQQEKPTLSELKIEDLAAGGDEVLSSRMIAGFYIAVDKQFRWQGRSWYRSTKGYVAPVDRFHETAGSDFKGVELDETQQLPIAWAYGSNKTRARYAIEGEKNQLRRDGSIERLTALNLTGESREINKQAYLKMVDGYWVRARDVRVTAPGAPPAGIAENEHWLDVNLTTQTVVLFAGSRPIYATLMSSGKEHRDKDKDHRTPTGEFRIQTKHITTTMDGDGTAAGDLPYSIESVPFVMYFHRSYALHGAFWHRNYGHRMSHGCVNLAPLDAKHIFFNTDPPVPQGTHGAWSKDDRPGSRVIVHD